MVRHITKILQNFWLTLDHLAATDYATDFHSGDNVRNNHLVFTPQLATYIFL